MSLNNENKLYTIKEFCEAVGISEQALIRFIMLKMIKAVKLGKSIKIPESEIDNITNFLTGNDNKKGSEFLQEPRLPVIYTAEEVAKILNLSVDNVWLLLKSGQLKGFKIRNGRSSWRIPQKYLDEFIENRIVKTKENESIP